MIQQYIQHKIGKKNRGVYFKKGKWLFHVFFIFVIWIGIQTELSNAHTTSASMLCGAILSIPFLSFFYLYCLYLIPVLFKRRQQKKFWIFLILLLAVLPLVQMALEHFVSGYFTQFSALKDRNLRKLYLNFLLSFTGITSGLFIMELAEGLRTAKETRTDDSELQNTERNLIKTKIAPDFMLHSLDGLIQLSEMKDKATPDSIILFSDVLRYRLYRSNETFLPLEDESNNLQKLFSFHNILAGEQLCTMEIIGDAEGKYLPSLSLMNIAEPLLSTCNKAKDWSLFLYLNIEDNELQIAIELNTLDTIEPALNNVEKNLKLLFGEQHTFATERNDSLNSIRICLQVQPKSIAS